MLKLVLAGLWAAVVTGASTFAAPMLLGIVSPPADTGGEEVVGVEELKSEMTSVPMIRGGEILGYVIIQLSFAADRSKLEELKLEPGPFLVDAAFRTIFSNPQIDFRRLRASELDVLTDGIASEANRRIGTRLVRQVLIQQLNFVKKEDIRTNWINKQAGNH